MKEERQKYFIKRYQVRTMRKISFHESWTEAIDVSEKVGLSLIEKAKQL